MEKYITLQDFLDTFKNKSISFKNFLKKAKVRSGKKFIKLQDYISSKKINIDDIELLYNHILRKNEYLTRFYNMSLRINKLDIHNSVEPMEITEIDNNNKPLYKNIIRNMHMEGILENTKSGIDNIPTYMDVLKDLYLYNTIDYKILTPSSLYYMKNGRLGSVFSSYYFRASIMNPYLVYSLNHNLLKGTKIFTPTLGWSSYCYGFLECPYVKEYVGTDVIPSVCKKTEEFSKKNYSDKIIDIYCKPSEDLLKSTRFINKYKNNFDVVFFSPPYYRLELYQGKEQSTERYKTYSEWLNGYWENTIKLCDIVLKKEGKLCYIVSGYGSTKTNNSINLVDDMNNITKKYFTYKRTLPMYNKNVHVTKHKETREQIILFEK
tara:strand:+ start:2767 stop:3900 length:1134 start_codon:yes stop_codon:yes gene_type:complete